MSGSFSICLYFCHLQCCLHCWCNSICCSYFHFVLRFVVFGLTFFFALQNALTSIEPSFFDGITRSTNWSLLCVRFSRAHIVCVCFFYSLQLMFRCFCCVCAIVILMPVFIYSWFSCLCDKNGSGNRLMFLWVIYFCHNISVQMHRAHDSCHGLFRAANVLINLLLLLYSSGDVDDDDRSNRQQAETKKPHIQHLLQFSAAIFFPI